MNDIRCGTTGRNILDSQHIPLETQQVDYREYVAYYAVAQHAVRGAERRDTRCDRPDRHARDVWHITSDVQQSMLLDVRQTMQSVREANILDVGI